MLKFIIKRICASIPTMLVLITVSFFLMRLAPGSPFTGERNLPPAVMANIEAKYHLNDPMYLQYFHYLKQLAQGDLGPSFKYKDFSVNELLAQSLPVSAELGFYAFLIAAIFGMFIGIIAALKQNSWLDYSLMSGAMIEVLNSPFIRTARAKGLPMSRIILRHALRPAMLPIVSFLGPAFVGIITGSIVIENVFGIPGVGQLFVNGALNRDYGMILGLTILVGIMTILFNAILDILYAIIDPKIRY